MTIQRWYFKVKCSKSKLFSWNTTTIWSIEQEIRLNIMYFHVIFIYIVYLRHCSQCRVDQVSCCRHLLLKKYSISRSFQLKNFNSKHMTLKHDLYVNITWHWGTSNYFVSMIIYNCIPFEATQGHVMVIIMSYFKVKCLDIKILS